MGFHLYDLSKYSKADKQQRDAHEAHTARTSALFGVTVDESTPVARPAASLAVQELVARDRREYLKSLVTPAPTADYSALEVRVLRSLFRMRPAWRLEGRITGFHPWRTMGFSDDIQQAADSCVTLKRKHRLYSVRVRANL